MPKKTKKLHPEEEEEPAPAVSEQFAAKSSDDDQSELSDSKDIEVQRIQEAESDREDAGPGRPKKKSTPGIVYLNYIPQGLTVAKTREILSEFGEVGRMYFEPVKKLNQKTRPTHRFSEGWVEFKKKKVAKRVAEVLNAKPVGGKRRAPYHDCLWSIKYLNRFRWTHLSERLSYEKAVKDQRLRTEIAKAKREASYYAKVLEQSIRMKRKRRAEQARL